MKRRVAITGIGVVNPSGIGKEIFWKHISEGVNNITPITRFPCENFPVQVAGQLKDFQAHDFVSRRFVIKTDTFTHYAWAAMSLALEDAQVDLKNICSYKTGVWLGNNGGGWDICERGMYELYRDGPEFVNPWQATAWFLSSPQGYLTIANQINGMSKSFVCDRASGASALYFAMRAIQYGHNDLIVAGGTEAPITNFALTCYYETGELAKAHNNVNGYQPFDKSRKGSLLGEGSTILILEEMEHAIKRGAKIYGELCSGAITTDSNPNNHQHFARAQTKALQMAGLSAKEIDVIFAEGAGTKQCDLAEANAIKESFSMNPEIPISCPKSGFGHLYGASTPTDVACGLLSAQQGIIPPTPNCNEVDPVIQLNIVQSALPKKVQNFMVNSRSREGCNVSLIVRTV